MLSLIYNPSIDLVMLVTAIVLDIILAIAVYRSNPKGATNRIFVLLTLCTIAWLVITHLVRVPALLDHALLLHRLGIFFAAPMSLFLLLLAHTMPSPTIQLRRAYLYAAIGSTLLMMALNLSPYAFTGHTIAGAVSSPKAGYGLLPFAGISTVFSILAIYLLIQKYLFARGEERDQFRLVLIGIGVMLVLIIITVLFPVLSVGSTFFLPFTPLYALIFLGFTAYAITTYHLFNIKILFAQALTLSIIIVLFAKIFGEESWNARVIDALVVIFMTIFGYFLVKSVQREVEQRELIEVQRKQLEIANQRQASLLHFISHEIKMYLTDGQNAFAAIADEDIGKVPLQVRVFAQKALGKMRQGVLTVMEILDASNLKLGTVTYKKERFDIRPVIEGMVEYLRPRAAERGLTLDFAVDTMKDYVIVGDKEMLTQHVIRNLIDNAIRYTLKGSVRATLARSENTIRFSVEDTGVGITPEDKLRLFTEGGRGRDSLKINVDSTGYGLFVAKQVVEGHGGIIHAESAGPGRGSEFIVELPVA